MARKIEVQLVGDDRSLRRAFGQSSSAGGKWGQRLKSAGKVAGLGIAAGVGLAAVALKKSIDAAKEAEVSQTKLKAQLKASGISYEQWGGRIDDVVQKQSRLAAIDDEEVQDSLTNLIRTTGDVTKAFKLNALAADVARGKNLDLETASRLVGKVAQGNTSALARYGIQLKEGATKQEALAELQKRFAGQAEAYGETTAGAQDRFAIALENVQEKVGQKLLPVLTRLFEWGVQFMGWAEENWPRFRQFVADAVDRIRPHFERLVEYWNGTLKPAIMGVVDFARELWRRFGDDIKRNLQAAISIVRSLLNVLKGIFEFVMAVIRGDWSAAWQALKDIARNALQGLLTLLRNIVTNVARLAKAIGGALKDGIVAGLRGLAELVGAAVRAAINAAISAFNALGDFKIPVPGPLPDIGVNFPDIPHIATGGSITRSGLAVVHRGETVTPARVNRAAFAAAGAPGGQYVILADRQFVTWLQGLNGAYARGNGGRSIF